MEANSEQPLHEVGSVGAQQPAPADPAVPEIDLDRLVWDPEYRRRMRPYLKNDS